MQENNSYSSYYFSIYRFHDSDCQTFGPCQTLLDTIDRATSMMKTLYSNLQGDIII